MSEDNNNNSCIANPIPPTAFNMQTLHSVSAIGDSYTDDFLKDSCEGIGNSQSIFTNNEPTQKVLSLSVDTIQQMKEGNDKQFISPLLKTDLNKNVTNEHYLQFMRLYNTGINEEKMCNTRNKVRCYKLNSTDHKDCNDISMDKLSRNMYTNQVNYSDTFSDNFESPSQFISQNAKASGLYID